MHLRQTGCATFNSLARILGEGSGFFDKEGCRTTLPQGRMVFGPGKPAENLLFLVSGAIRVLRLSACGQEDVLYRAQDGETGALMIACLLGLKSDAVKGITETEVELIMFPRRDFDTLMGVSEEFRGFVFASYSNKVTDLFHSIESTTQQQLDVRVARKVLEFKDARNAVYLIHRHLSNEIGAEPEAVSYQLGTLERNGWLCIAQGQIELLDIAALRQLAKLN